MNHEKAGGYISRITFNNGESLDISRDDIVIFVGPNNAGKSQSLKDIYTLSEQKMPTTVISDINITKNNLPISATLEKLSEGEHRGGFTTYIVLNHRMHIYNSTDKSFLSEQYYGEYRALFVANLDTAARLTICNPPDSIPRNASKQHPIHYAAFDGKYRKWLSDSFKKAFGIDYDAIRTDYKNIVSNLHSDKEKINRIAAKAAISQIMDNGKSAELSKNELKQIRDVISTTSIWSKLKSSGVSALPSGNATASFKHMEQVLQGNGIYIVPVGELECFVREVGGHGPEWANTVLERYPNLDDAVYHRITEFIESMKL